MTKKFLLVGLAVLVLTGCGRKPKNQEHQDAQSVTVLVMGSEDDAHLRTYIGEVASDVEMNLSFPLGGQITSVNVRNGQHVRKGDLLATVDQTTAKSLHDAAEATLHQAEDGYARMKMVRDGGGVTEVRWVQMETDLEKARQTEISTRKHLQDCYLYAPKDGIVSMSDNIQVGEEISPLKPVCKLLNLSAMHIAFSVPEQEIGLVKKGEKATAIMPSFPGKELKVEVSDKGLLANPMGHTYQVKADIKDAAGVDLLPGQVAKVRLTSTAPEGLIVPAWCVQTMADGLVVWTIRGGKAYRTPIKVKSYVQNGVLLSSGLQPGDSVITDGYQKLYNGAPVSAQILD